MTGTFLIANTLVPERLDWGQLMWISRPSETASGQITAVVVTFEPGRGHDFHKHPRQEELLYVLEGQIEQWLETERRTLTPGDAVFIPRDVVHASFNTTTRPAKVLALLSPSMGDAGYESVEVAGDAPWNSLKK
jgi:quercetin dioxygenase-like cupin family protein